MSQELNWYMNVSAQVAEGIGAHTNLKIQEYLEEVEGLEGQDIAFIQIGYAFSPDNLTTQDFIERGPYGNPKNYKAQMDASVERNWLEPVKDGEYKLSEKGREQAEQFLAYGEKWFGNLPALTDDETNRIAELLEKLVQAAHQLPKPAKKPTLEIGIRLKPAADVPAMLRVRRHLTDLAYYRDDAHIAAWQSYGIDGQVWETLTFLWKEEAANGNEIAEKIAEYRNYDADDYTAAFDKLVSKGWAKNDNENYLITEKGKKIRQEAEDATDQLFYTPFSALDKEEIFELKTLLEELAEIVKPPETEAEPA